MTKSAGALSEVWLGCNQDWFVFYDKDAAECFFIKKGNF